MQIMGFITCYFSTLENISNFKDGEGSSGVTLMVLGSGDADIGVTCWLSKVKVEYDKMCGGVWW